VLGVPIHVRELAVSLDDPAGFAAALGFEPVTQPRFRSWTYRPNWTKRNVPHTSAIPPEDSRTTGVLSQSSQPLRYAGSLSISLAVIGAGEGGADMGFIVAIPARGESPLRRERRARVAKWIAVLPPALSLVWLIYIWFDTTCCFVPLTPLVLPPFIPPKLL
jgi:hypothetical protein